MKKTPDQPTSNLSNINNYTFETADYLANMDINPYAFISLWAVDEIQITNNTFTNSNPEAYQYNNRWKGIGSSSENSTQNLNLNKYYLFF